MEDNVIKFKKKRVYRKKLYHAESMASLQEFVKRCESQNFQGFVAVAWLKDDQILKQYSLNTEIVRPYTLIGALESLKKKLLDISEYLDESVDH